MRCSRTSCSDSHASSQATRSWQVLATARKQAPPSQRDASHVMLLCRSWCITSSHVAATLAGSVRWRRLGSGRTHQTCRLRIAAALTSRPVRGPPSTALAVRTGKTDNLDSYSSRFASRSASACSCVVLPSSDQDLLCVRPTPVPRLARPPGQARRAVQVATRRAL